MLSRKEDVEAHALKERGWSVLAIARHLGRSDEPAPAAMMYLAGRVPPVSDHHCRSGSSHLVSEHWPEHAKGRI